MSIHQNKNSGPLGCLGGLLVLVVAMVWVLTFTQVHRPVRTTVYNNQPTPIRNPIQDQLTPRTLVQRVDGVAMVVLIDTSGSMNDPVTGEGGMQERKITIAQRRLIDLIEQVRQASVQNPDRKLRWGVYEFSSRRTHASSCRPVIPLNDVVGQDPQGVIMMLKPEGGTPIGNAMIYAKSELDRCGLTRMHMLVITDGQNTQGYDPTDVAQAMSRLSDADRASMYVIAFDIAEEVFQPIRDAGVLVLPAGNEADLRNTLDYIVTGKILAEQPMTQ